MLNVDLVSDLRSSDLIFCMACTGIDSVELFAAVKDNSVEKKAEISLFQ